MIPFSYVKIYNEINNRVVSDKDHKYLEIERNLLGVDSEIIEKLRDDIDFESNKLIFANDEESLDQTHIRWTQSLLHDKDFNPDRTPKKRHWHVTLSVDGPITLKAINKMIDRIWLKK